MGKSDIDPWGEEDWDDDVELDNIIGSTFIGFEKKDDVFYNKLFYTFEEETTIKLEFDNCILKFDGFLFEHNKPLVDKKVQYIFDQQTLGFKAMNQIGYCDLRQLDYRQAYIGMENREKLEMLIVYRNPKLIYK